MSTKTALVEHIGYSVRAIILMDSLVEYLSDNLCFCWFDCKITHFIPLFVEASLPYKLIAMLIVLEDSEKDVRYYDLYTGDWREACAQNESIMTINAINGQIIDRTHPT